MSPKKQGRRSPPRKSAPGRARTAQATGGGAGSTGRASGTTGRASGATRGAARGGARKATRSGAPFYTPGGSAFRHSVERTTAPVLLILTGLPRPVVMFAPLVLVLLGFFLPLAAGLVALGIFLMLTGWLGYLSWPRADARARAVRLAMFALVIALVVIRVTRA